MQKSLALLLIGCACYANAIESSSLRTKLKNLAQLQSQAQQGLPDCNLTAPVLGDLSGDLLDWCPDEFGAQAPTLGGSLATTAS